MTTVINIGGIQDETGVENRELDIAQAFQAFYVNQSRYFYSLKTMFQRSSQWTPKAYVPTFHVLLKHKIAGPQNCRSAVCMDLKSNRTT